MAWLGLIASIAWNWHNYKHGRRTICNVTRQVLPRPAAMTALGGVFTYLAVHIARGYPPRT